MTNILVTGGAGYIGSHVCKLLVEQGFAVTAADNLIRGDQNRLQWCPLMKGDVTDADFLDGVLDKTRPDTVIHLAALSNPLESLREPRTYYANNAMGTMRILDAMLRAGVNNLIFASSSTVYADKQQQVPYMEGDLCNPSFPYASGKWMGERLIEDYGNAYGLRYVIMRLFNPAGADALGILGETPDRVSHVVATLVKAAMGIVSVFPLYGTDYSTPDGTSIRDYVHVTDVAAAHRCALRHLEAGKDSTIVNIGSGKGISLKHLVAKVEERCARSIRVEYRPQRNIYQPYLVADIAKAMDILGWRPCHSSLDNIIDSTFRWLTNAIEEEKTVPNALHSL